MLSGIQSSIFEALGMGIWVALNLGLCFMEPLIRVPYYFGDL